MKSAYLWIGALAGGAALALMPLTARSQARQSQFKPEVKIEVLDGHRYITSNGMPDHPTGRFPNAGNPNTIAPQSYRLRVPAMPQVAARHEQAGAYLFGVAVNGVPFDPGTAELWNGDFRWHFEARSGYFAQRGSLGADENLAHVQPNGAYHYHGLPLGLLKKLDYEKKPALVGYAADGYPIYGPFGYSDPKNGKSALKRLKSSYRLKEEARPTGADGPGGTPDGSFAQDYAYTKGAGDLDELNGREGVTPEYPKGTYYYVLTDTFPFVPRSFRGVPDVTFERGSGGPGGGNDGPGGPRRGAMRGPATPGGPRVTRKTLTATPNGVYVLRGDRLYRYDPKTLKPLGVEDVPRPRNRPPQ
jgi:hypothetical protein